MVMRLGILIVSLALGTLLNAQSFDWQRIKSKAIVAKQFCKTKGMDTQYCFLLDMKIHSGKNRFFVYDFKVDTIVDQGIVSHGCGKLSWGSDETKTTPVFSNTPESHLSSIGKYRIGKRGYSSWGIHVKYWLHGLDKTNSNAVKRIIVLHGWDMVPESNVYPQGCPEGWGCPAVSNGFMKRIDKRLKASSKGVLLWMFN